MRGLYLVLRAMLVAVLVALACDLAGVHFEFGYPLTMIASLASLCIPDHKRRK
jgi:hypothetical protein